MTIKLIASDLDGTLLLNGAQRLRDDTCDLISRLHDKGILFFAASGRQYYNLQNLFAPVRDKIGYICENGCVSFFAGKRLNKDTLDRNAGQEVIRAVMERDGFEVMISGENICYIHPKDNSFYHYIRDFVKYNVTIAPDILATKEDYLKIALFEKNGNTDFPYWHERLSGLSEHCYVVTSGREWIDIMPSNINKGYALRNVLDVLGISPSECMAVGDNYNDSEMLELAGYPASVNSAKPEIKSLAKIHTDTVEELFAMILDGVL